MGADSSSPEGHGTFGELRVVEQTRGHGRPEWELLVPLKHVTAAGVEYVAPSGMRTNFASVPWFLTWVVSRTGRHNKAAVIHDLLWRQANEGQVDRRVADEVFRDGLGDLGVSGLRRWMMWTGVRQGGLFTKNRGSWPLRDIFLVAIITVLVAPIVIPATVIVVAARLLLWLIDLIPVFVRRRVVPARDEI